MQGKKNETEHVHFDSKTRVFIEILVLSLIFNEFYLFSCILFLFKASDSEFHGTGILHTDRWHAILAKTRNMARANPAPTNNL